MSIIDFTHLTCKTTNIMNNKLIKNFEEHFAMYSLNTIENIPNIEVSKDSEAYIIKGTEEECTKIMDKITSFRCSHFDNTLYPVCTIIKEGLRVEFKSGE